MSDSVSTLRDRIHSLMTQTFDDLATMVHYQSVYAPPPDTPPDCNSMVAWLMNQYAKLGFQNVTMHVTSDKSKAVTGFRPAQAPSAPTVLLYFHHDVQPVVHVDDWTTPPWTLTAASDGRWHGRGSADCKGNIAVQLTAIRALLDRIPVILKIVGEGSEEQGTGGLEDFVPKNADLLAADVILVMDAGNAAVGKPTLTASLRGLTNARVTVKTLEGPMHSGEFGGAAPDALAALIAMLATLRDAQGNTTIRGLSNDQTWQGEPYDAAQFREDARVLDGVDLLGSGTVADMLWSRLAATVIGIDCPSVANASPAVQGEARALINLRVPPGISPDDAYKALHDHLLAVAPWHAQVTVEQTASGQPFVASERGQAHDTLVAALRAAYGGTPVVSIGQGGSIPLCTIFKDTFPDAEIMLLGVEEPKALIHAPNESVAPSEIENMALAVALFLLSYGASTT